MPRYIDATKLLKEFQALPCCRNGYSDEYDKARIFAMIDNQPTVDVVERKKGKWKQTTKNLSSCTSCGNCILTDRTRGCFYCPNCGADMRGETDSDVGTKV